MIRSRWPNWVLCPELQSKVWFYRSVPNFPLLAPLFIPQPPPAHLTEHRSPYWPSWLSSNTRLLSLFELPVFVNFISISTLLPTHIFLNPELDSTSGFLNRELAMISPTFELLLFQTDSDLKFSSYLWLRYVCWQRTPSSALLPPKQKPWHGPCDPHTENSTVMRTL